MLRNEMLLLYKWRRAGKPEGPSVFDLVLSRLHNIVENLRPVTVVKLDVILSWHVCCRLLELCIVDLIRELGSL